MAEEIKRDVGTAMKAGDRERAGALRLVLAELQRDAKEGPGDEQAVLRRERKRRRDAEVAFRDAGRAELAAQEAAEGALIETYLPSELSDVEVDALVRAAIADTGAESVRDMGKAIKHAMAAADGRAAGSRVSARVKAALT
ncbi:MAG: GatB/YqeY domain-containing protein [Solirubrobacteraceae bacterium]